MTARWQRWYRTLRGADLDAVPLHPRQLQTTRAPSCRFSLTPRLAALMQAFRGLLQRAFDALMDCRVQDDLDVEALVDCVVLLVTPVEKP